MPTTTTHPATQAISVRGLLTRARDQDAVDQIWTLAVASQVLRERHAPRAPLDWVDGQLRLYLDSHAHGRAAAMPPAIIDTLADLARDQHEATTTRRH